MTLQIHAWERPLLSMAQEAWRMEGLASTGSVRDKASLDKALLEIAYAHSKTITAHHSRSFYLASSLLPVDKQRAVRALYAFCRTVDDLVDRPTGDPQTALLTWRKQALAPHPPADDLVAVAWADARTRYQIPPGYSEQLLDGVSRDLEQTRYDTFDDLVTYAYGVASTVGLMSMHIVGFLDPAAIPYAIKLGVALQLTNILRDVREDWGRGRVYLPQEELAFFSVTEADLAKGRVDDRWRTFMRFQIARNRQLYDESWPGIALLNKDSRFAIAAAAELYRGILDDIEAHDYDVFNRRAYVSTWGKLGKLPGIWWRSRQLSPHQHLNAESAIRNPEYAT
ncbi:MAG: squalene/phytoene synthase family protein [Anaerolineae bacterium]|nr:squalene/phytoene synthase family protein [Anaerolineae bacterium]